LTARIDPAIDRVETVPRMTRICVIIPFFSREPSELIRTVRAALRQESVPTPTVIVVDDGSPVSADGELLGLEPAERDHIKVIRKQNGGPPTARNAGLDAVPADTEWIAFLDADDEYQPDHLATAIEAMRQGYDFFFADFIRIGDPPAHFRRCDFNPLDHPLLPGSTTVHVFTGDFFDRNLVRSPVGTSTVVFRASALGATRFVLFPWTWEDLMFWLDAARATSRVVFDHRIQVHCGMGQIAGRDGWRSQADLKRRLWYIQHFDNVVKRFPLTPAQAAVVADEVRSHTEGFARTAIGLLAVGELPNPRTVIDFARWNPSVTGAMLRIAIRGIRRRVAPTRQ
jgi:succinoglycan biosynthesis protein ExoW